MPSVVADKRLTANPALRVEDPTAVAAEKTPGIKLPPPVSEKKSGEPLQYQEVTIAAQFPDGSVVKHRFDLSKLSEDTAIVFSLGDAPTCGLGAAVTTTALNTDGPFRSQRALELLQRIVDKFPAILRDGMHGSAETGALHPSYIFTLHDVGLDVEMKNITELKPGEAAMAVVYLDKGGILWPISDKQQGNHLVTVARNADGSVTLFNPNDKSHRSEEGFSPRIFSADEITDYVLPTVTMLRPSTLSRN